MRHPPISAMSRSPILLVDDDSKLLRVVTLRLEAEGYAVTAFATPQEALEKLLTLNPGLVITDWRMPELNGVQFLLRLQEIKPGLPVILFSAYGGVTEAVHAVQAGAIDFMTKPIDWNRLLELLDHYLAESDVSGVANPFGDSVATRSPTTLAVLEDAYRAATTSSAILIRGASGTGKGLLAKAIHRASERREGPFIALNCAAVPSELLESELFGHKRGAFTGAQSDQPGLFRAAHRGTIFLDEIGDMSLDLQAKLLRVLEEREVRPVGEVHTIAVDVRVISATHRDLEACAETGDFRSDLFYRLNVVCLSLPSLEQRCEDIPLLVAQRLAKLAENGAPRRVISPEGIRLLVAASWPGNVRQLFNVVERATVLAPGRVISAGLVRRCLGQSGPGLPSLDEARDEFTRRYLTQLLMAANGSVSGAAQMAQRNRSDFYRLLSRYGLDPADFKDLA